MKTDLSLFKVFQNNDEFFEMLDHDEVIRKVVWKQLLVIAVFSLIYGMIMGSYNGLLQCLVTGIKIPALILLSLIICFPALFVIQYMIGSTMTVYQMAVVILSGFIVFSTISLSFAPIVLFFMITSDNYAFLKLLHVGIFTFSGIFTIRTIIRGLSYSCEKKNIYPRLGMNIFKIWIVIFAFVSSQLAWNLRPFVGSRDLPFELLRHRESNFYIAVVQSVGQMLNPTEDTKETNGTDSEEKAIEDQPSNKDGQ